MIPLFYGTVEGGSTMALKEALAFEEDLTAAEELFLLLVSMN